MQDYRPGSVIVDVITLEDMLMKIAQYFLFVALAIAALMCGTWYLVDVEHIGFLSLGPIGLLMGLVWPRQWLATLFGVVGLGGAYLGLHLREVF